MIQSILLFFAIIFGLGFTISKILKLNESKNALEKNLLRLGFGLGIFPLLTITLNLVKIPLNWWIFLTLSLATPIFFFIKDKFKIQTQNIFTKRNIHLFVVLLIALILLFVYVKGAFVYSYLEDDDSWDHASASKYVALQQTYSRQVEPFKRTYLEPYPPSYDVLMGVLHQTNDSINWTLKFFNSLLISLGLIFFYFFAKQFTSSKNKALIATFILAVLPCFMSHFIWSQTLALILFFPAFFCLEKIKNYKEDKPWFILSILIIASILVSQPSSAVIFGALFGLFLLGKAIHSFWNEKKINKTHIILLLSGILGFVVSMLYWIPTFIKFGWQKMLHGIGLTQGALTIKDTSLGVIYGIKDFAIAPLVSKMDQPTGLGLVIFLLLVFSVVVLIKKFKELKTKPYLLVSLLWLVFTFLGTEANAFPFKLFPHRFWVFFSIPVAFLVAEGINIISNSFDKQKTAKYFVLAVIFIGIIWTSAYPKYMVETSMWPFGQSFSSGEEIKGYIWIYENLPKNTPILNLCYEEHKVIGFDMYSPPFDHETGTFWREIENKTSEDIYNIAKKKDSKYIIMESTCLERINESTINQKLKELAESDKFGLVYSTNAMFLFKVI